MPDKQLNDQQIEAIKHGDGPLLIIAGAGTGKTTVVTERIKWLIAEKKAAPSEILALTFTEKAAQEMEERIDVALPYGYTELWAMTFHSFCDRILRSEGIHIGVNPAYKLLSDTTATSMLRRSIYDLDLTYFRPMGNPNKFISGLLSHFNRLKDEDVSVADYNEWAKTKTIAAKTEEEILEAQKYSELALIYKFYQELKLKRGYMDFGDLICMALELFRKRPNVLTKYHERFKYFLVDEFQDTNFAQNQLVDILVNKQRNLTVVADDDQAIYRWRGAATSNVLQFRSTYPDSKLVVLSQNYRSTQEILNRSYDLIQFNNPDRLEVKEGISKKLISIRKQTGDKVHFIHAARAEDEAERVTRKILELKETTKDLEFRDFAILVRANAHADIFSKALQRQAIPYQFLGPGQLFQQPEIKDMIAYLRVLNHIGDDVSFLRLLSMDFFAIPGRDLAGLGMFARKYNLHLFEVCEIVAEVSKKQIADKPLITSESEQKLKSLVEIVCKQLDLLKTDTAGQLLFSFFQDTGMLKSMIDYKFPFDEVKVGNITRFFNKLKTFETDSGDGDVRSVVEWVDLCMELGESPMANDTDWPGNDAVNILTIHSAKGLEFKNVFLVNLVSQRFPSIERSEQIPIPQELIKEELPEGDFHLQEERRLFYVGMTRAKDKLFLTAANLYGDGKREKKISPFVSEALGENYVDTQEPLVSQLSLLDWEKPKTSTNGAIARIPVTYLSYSQIQAFKDCPLHYKARYILKIPESPTASLTFGTCIHKVLQEFYTDQTQDIRDLYKRNWISLGYINSKQEEEFFAKGEKFLAQYLETEFDPQRKPVALEQMFTVPLVGKGRMIKIGGKIDRVDIADDGSIEIIDYKTGANSLTEKEAQSNLQLSFYALAATLIRQAPFNKNPDDVKLTLYYFDEQKKITTTRTAEQLEAARDEIFSIADQISSSDFKCTKSQLCKSCEYKMLCDFV